MANPVKAVASWLRGEDLQYRGPLLSPPEKKLMYVDDLSVAFHRGTLIHGPGATDILSGVYGGDGNSAVFACLRALSMAYIEPPLKVWRNDGQGKRTALPDHPLQQLLDEPNTYMDAPEIAFWIQWARHLDGNAYLRKIRSGNDDTGNVIELWPISPSLIRPYVEKGSEDFITSYKYQYAAGKYEYLAPHNIIHFKLGIDDRDHRLGLSPLKRLVRQVSSDDEATRFSDALLKNYGVPGLVVQVPKEATGIDEAKAREIKAKVAGEFGSDGRGNVGVLTGGATMTQFGFNPEQMQLKSLHDVPETRIAAVMGVPPAIAGLGVGLEQSSNFASLRQIRENFTEVNLVPLWTMDAAKLNRQLRRDFTSDRGVFVMHDLSDVRALQEDEDKKWARVAVAYEKKLISKNEGRTDLGYPPVHGGDEIAETPPPEPSEPPTNQRQLPPPAEDQKARVREVKAGAVDLEDFPALLKSMRELATPAFASAVDTYLDGQRRRVKRALTKAG
jgi:HK97 family phage portal protein